MGKGQRDLCSSVVPLGSGGDEDASCRVARAKTPVPPRPQRGAVGVRAHISTGMPCLRVVHARGKPPKPWGNDRFSQLTGLFVISGYSGKASGRFFGGFGGDFPVVFD